MQADEDLMAAYLAGDSRAFEVLYDRYEGRIFGYLRRAIGSASRAEDLLQQTFLNMHRARDRYRLGSPVAPWLFTIARNVYRQEMRRSSRRPEAELDTSSTPATDSADPAHALQRQRDAAALMRAIHVLPEAQRQAVELCRLFELSHAEAAAIAACSVDAMKLRLFRGLKALRRKLSPHPNSWATDEDDGPLKASGTKKSRVK